MIIIKEPFEFDWDLGNIDKNLLKHGVTNEEIEQIFWDTNKKILSDPIHSDEENRFIILGKTISGRLLFVVYTTRNQKIRIISARDINKREIKLYNQK